jgi:hypothetical protein
LLLCLQDVSDLRKTNEALVAERDRLRSIEAQLAEKQQELRRKERKHEKVK